MSPIAPLPPSHPPAYAPRWDLGGRPSCSRRTAEGSLPSVEEVRRRTRRRSVDSSTAARELSPGLPLKTAPATNHGRRRSLDLTGAHPLAKKAATGGGGEAGSVPSDDDDDKRKAVHTGGVLHAAQSVQDHRGDWRGDDAAAASTAALRKGSAMRRMSDISPIRRSSLSQAPSDSMQAQGEGLDSDDGKPGSLRARGMHRRASHDVSHRRASHDGGQRRTSLTASLLPSLSARRIQPASAADEKKPSFPPAKYQAALLSHVHCVHMLYFTTLLRA